MQEALDSNEDKIISFIKMNYLLYFNSMPLSSFLDLIKFEKCMEMPRMSAMDDHGTYESAVSERKFLLAIANVLEDKMIEEVTTLYFSLL